MSTSATTGPTGTTGLNGTHGVADNDHALEQPRRLSTETKAAPKTTELIVFVAMVVAVIVTANLYDGNGSNGDPFGATTAIRYIVYLTVAYVIARGLAKSGSREHYDA